MLSEKGCMDSVVVKLSCSIDGGEDTKTRRYSLVVGTYEWHRGIDVGQDTKKRRCSARKDVEGCSGV